MRILVTGSAGRVGRAIYIKLMRTHDVVGFDKTPCSTVDYIGDIRDSALLNEALKISTLLFIQQPFMLLMLA